LCEYCGKQPPIKDGLCEACARDRDVEKLIAEFENHAKNPRYGPELAQIEED